MPPGVEAGVEGRAVEADGARVLLQVGRGQPLRVREQPVVHLPEPALVPRALRRLRRPRRVLVAGEREVAEDQADAALVARFQLADRRQHAPAERALELGELDDGDRRVLRTAARASPATSTFDPRRGGRDDRGGRPRPQLGQEAEAPLGQAALAQTSAPPPRAPPRRSVPSSSLSCVRPVRLRGPTRRRGPPWPRSPPSSSASTVIAAPRRFLAQQLPLHELLEGLAARSSCSRVLTSMSRRAAAFSSSAAVIARAPTRATTASGDGAGERGQRGRGQQRRDHASDQRERPRRRDGSGRACGQAAPSRSAW